jgi:glycosyltransferase involved in cell wall biosynthesis
MKVLYYCESDSGGIVEYAIKQVEALRSLGVNVVVLCRPGFPIERVKNGDCLPLLPRQKSPRGFLVKLRERIMDSRNAADIVADTAERLEVDYVLNACYAEYFAPLWVNRWKRLRANVPIGVIAHDPVRDYVLGPGWWHRWSIREAYSFIQDVFVHDDTPVDFGGRPPPGVRIHELPHGPFDLAPVQSGRSQTRLNQGLEEKDQVFLSFGQIRDGKNLDRFIRVMPFLPAFTKLVVAGKSDTSSQRPVSYYQELARSLGVASRCVWIDRYIDDSELGDLFAAADFVLMVYSSRFRSASGVMNAAVTARKPILGSSGDGPFKSSMENYGLGVFVEPDSDAAVKRGAIELMETQSSPRWETYETENSWKANASSIINAIRTSKEP